MRNTIPIELKRTDLVVQAPLKAPASAGPASEILAKKVLLISNKVFHYRIPVYNYLNKKMQESGYELTVITNKIEKHSIENINFTLLEIPFEFSSYKGAVKQLDPTIVILFMHIRNIIVWPLLAWFKLRRTKLIYWNHGINLQTPHNILKKCIFRIFHKTSDAIVLYSENEKKYISKKYWHKIFIANNTLGFHSFPVIRQSKKSIKSELEIGFDKIVLFVGRITENKRLDDLLEAAKYLNRNVGVVIVGGGLTATQSEIIKGCDNLIYLGEIYENDAINRIFKMADVFSIPGKIGLGINQAFYWGLPVVTENVRHSPEIIYLKENINGFIVERNTAHMLADKINFLLSSNEIYERFSRAARKEITQNASIDRMCKGFIDALEFLEQG